MLSLIISKENSMYGDENYMGVFLKCQERYLNDLLVTNGYVYFDKIHEMLGIEWNPENENTCILYKEHIRGIVFEVFPKNDSYLVNVLY